VLRERAFERELQRETAVLLRQHVAVAAALPGVPRRTPALELRLQDAERTAGPLPHQFARVHQRASERRTLRPRRAR
jgi:hypothetical protein